MKVKKYILFLVLFGSLSALCQRNEHSSQKINLYIEGPKNITIPGSTIEYKIFIQNDNSYAIKHMTVAYKLPERLFYISSGPQGCVDKSSIIWKLSRIAPRKKYTIRLKLRIPSGGIYKHQVKLIHNHETLLRAQLKTKVYAGPTGPVVVVALYYLFGQRKNCYIYSIGRSLNKLGITNML